MAYKSRPFKGRSLIKFPADYIIIDIETTGLSPYNDEIIELAAIKYQQYKPVSKFSTLIKPKSYISAFITNLTGISNLDVCNAPTISESIQDFANFLGSNLLVGYNVNFDVNFIYDNMMKILGRPLTNDFVDVKRLAQKELPHLLSHSQTNVAQHFGISTEGNHRALVDCEICNRCMESIKKHILDRGSSLNDFYGLFSSR